MEILVQRRQISGYVDLGRTLQSLIYANWGKDNIAFEPAYPKVSDPDSLKTPIITYEVVSKKPGRWGEQREVKPRVREQITIKDKETKVLIDQVEFTITVSDSLGATATQTYQMIVGEEPVTETVPDPEPLPTELTLHTGNPPNAIPDQEYLYQLKAYGGTGPYTFALTGGELPPGMVLKELGTIEGMPVNYKMVNLEGLAIQIWGQMFDYTIAYDVWADTGKEADEIAEKFQDFMFRFTGYLKEIGVAEIRFEEMTTKDPPTNWRANLSNRSVIYAIRIDEVVSTTIPRIKSIGIETDVHESIYDLIISVATRDYIAYLDSQQL